MHESWRLGLIAYRTSPVKDGAVTTWADDDAYRLTGQHKTGQAATFVYDPSGNITLKHHEGILLDDLGHVHERRKEMEVPFTLLAERDEWADLLVTSTS